MKKSFAIFALAICFVLALASCTNELDATQMCQFDANNQYVI